VPGRSSRTTARALRRIACTVAAATLLVACTTAEDEPATTDEPPAAEDVDLGAAPDPQTILDADRDDPPGELVVEDLVVGDGPPASAGDPVTVHYVGVDWESGEQFDSSWDRSTPFVFTLGAGEVIPGWDQGVEGMRAGGRRVLTIPPGLAYGDRGAGEAIAPGATLVFVVDLLEDAPSER
jgi:peptidylprolyl isomerase